MTGMPADCLSTNTTLSVLTASGLFRKYANISNNVSSLAYGTWDTYQGYIKDGNSFGYNATKAASKTFVSWAAGMESAKICATYGTMYGGVYGGIIGGIAGGIVGSFAGGYISDYSVDLLFY